MVDICVPGLEWGATIAGMRLFAAVLPPEDVAAELAVAVQELTGVPGADGLRWTGRPGWHFTLAFYGDVDDGVVPALEERLARAARRGGPFELAVRGGGEFGHGKVLWAGADGDLAELRLLAERAEAAGRRAGVDMGEHRRYRPHLTLARSREGVEPAPFTELLGEFAGAAWTVRELALVRSNLPHSGVAGERARYEVVGRWRLGGAG